MPGEPRTGLQSNSPNVDLPTSHGSPPLAIGPLCWVLSFFVCTITCGQMWRTAKLVHVLLSRSYILGQYKAAFTQPSFFISGYPHWHYFYYYAVELPTVPACLLGGQGVTLSWPEQPWKVSLSTLLEVSLEYTNSPSGPSWNTFCYPQETLLQPIF